MQAFFVACCFLASSMSVLKHTEVLQRTEACPDLKRPQDGEASHQFALICLNLPHGIQVTAFGFRAFANVT